MEFRRVLFRSRFSHIATNLALAAINAVVAAAFTFAILVVTEWSRAHSVGLLHRVPLPNWLHWILAILLFDCWQYWWHRFNHRAPFLWRFHSVHHSDAEL